MQSQVAVPNDLDRQLSVARQALERARLKVGKINPANAPEASFVTKQSPAAGAKAEPGTSVDLEVKAPNEDPRIGIIRHMAEQPDFKAVSASESYAALFREAGWQYLRTGYPASKLLGVIEAVKA